MHDISILKKLNDPEYIKRKKEDDLKYAEAVKRAHAAYDRIDAIIAKSKAERNKKQNFNSP